MPDLSREAMQLLELNPVWERRDAVRADRPAQPLMVVGVAAGAVPQKLWQSIARQLLAMGFSHTGIDKALIMGSPQADRCQQALLEYRPQVVLCWSETLFKELTAVAATALKDIRVEVLPDLQALSQSPAEKARCWKLLCALKRSVGVLVDADQRV